MEWQHAGCYGWERPFWAQHWFPSFFTSVSSLRLQYKHPGWRSQTNIPHTMFSALENIEDQMVTLWTGFRVND